MVIQILVVLITLPLCSLSLNLLLVNNSIISSSILAPICLVGLVDLALSIYINRKLIHLKSWQSVIISTFTIIISFIGMLYWALTQLNFSDLIFG